MTTYKCTTGNGEWHHCVSCHFAGDNNELAAAVWKAPLEVALNRLAALSQQPPPASTATYLGHYVGNRRRANEMWQKAQEYFPNSNSDMRSIRLKLGLPTDLPHHLWKQRGGQYVGGLDRKTLEGLAYGSPTDRPMDKRNFFQGPVGSVTSWREAAVLPLFDLPGRICAFLFASQHAAAPFVSKYRHVYHSLSRAHRPGGLCMPEALKADQVLAVLDPFLALRLHVRHLRDRSDTLPVCGAYGPAKTPETLAEAGQSRRIVLWAHKTDADLFRHAIAVGAEVAISTAIREDILKQLNRMSARQWVTKTLQQAQPWSVLLEQHLAALGDVEASDLLTQLDLSSTQLRRFVAECAPSTRERIHSITEEVLHVRKVRVDNSDLIENREGWIRINYKGERTLVTNAPFRIEQVIYQPRLDKSFYKGYVLWQGEQVPFVAPQTEMDRESGLWISRHLIRENRGVANYIRGTHNLLQVALAFHQPELVRGTELYGWDPRRNAFVFPSFVLHVGGRVEDNIDVYVAKQAPGRHLLRPVGLSEIEWNLLGRDEPTQNLAWAVAACTLHNLLAPSLDRGPWSFCLVGNGRKTAHEIALSLGCQSVYNDAVRLEKHWPTMMTQPIISTRRTSLGWARSHSNCLVETEDLIGLALSTYQNWGRIQTPNTYFLPAELSEVLAKVVPNFLHWVCRKNLVWGCPSHSLWDNLLEEIDAWRVHHNLSRLPAAVSRMPFSPNHPGAAADSFGEIIARLHADGELCVQRTGYAHKTRVLKREPSRLVYLDNNSLVWLPKGSINTVLTRRCVMPMSIPDITASLETAGILKAEMDYQGEPGWVVPEEWWNSRVRLYHSTVKNLIKLHEPA